MLLTKASLWNDPDGAPMKHVNFLSDSNSKLNVDGIFTWGIPAYRSKSGMVTCPNAGACLTGCYARQGFYVMPSVAKKQEERLALALSPAFVETISAEIKRRDIRRVRVHDAGDFFSVAYTNAWLEIMRQNPDTRFYAYTKMVSFFKARAKLLPPNFHVVFSEGGTQGARIDTETDRHSRVFSSASELRKAKYSDAHKRDMPALLGKLRVGLVYHGAPSRSWATA